MISKQLSGPPKPASASATIGANQSLLAPPSLMLDLVGALQGAVDPLRKLWARIRRIERLVGIHGAGGVGVGRGLPAGQIDRLEARADHLHGLVASDGAERADRLVLLQQLPQLERAAAGERVLDRERAAQAQNVVGTVRTLDPVEAAGRSGNHVTKVSMCESPVIWNAGKHGIVVNDAQNKG